MFARFCHVLARTQCLNLLLRMSICSLGVADNPFILYFGISLLCCFVVCCVCWICPPCYLCAWGCCLFCCWCCCKVEIWVDCCLNCYGWHYHSRTAVLDAVLFLIHFPLRGAPFHVDWMGVLGEDSSSHWLMSDIWTSGWSSKFSPWKPHSSLASSSSCPLSQLLGGSLLYSSITLLSPLWGVVYPATYGVLLGGVPDFVGDGGTGYWIKFLSTELWRLQNPKRVSSGTQSLTR